MMPIIEQPISGQEINVPPRLPIILKQFCKAAIRTQPYDLIKWSSSYFRALADGEEPPVKLRLEYPPTSTLTELTLGFLKVLLRQFGDYNKTLPVETISHRWDCLCLDRKDLNLILMIGKFRRRCQVKKFLAIAVGLIGSNLFETMIMICELFTLEPDGGSAMIPVTLFMEIYGYLAGLRCDGGERDSDDDPTDYIVWDESEKSGSSEFRKSSENKISVDRICSINSQDTEADINLDLELVSKEEELMKMEQTPELLASYSAQNEEASEKSEGTSDNCSLKVEDGEDICDTKTEMTKEVPSNGRSSSEDSKIEEKERRASSESVQKDKSNGSGKISSMEGDSTVAKKMKIANGKLLKYYPSVPGIGPKLSAEEVASVAIWMNECARLQEGMVGPRNLRHMNCPPLDRPHKSSS